MIEGALILLALILVLAITGFIAKRTWQEGEDAIETLAASLLAFLISALVMGLSLGIILLVCWIWSGGTA